MRATASAASGLLLAACQPSAVPQSTLGPTSTSVANGSLSGAATDTPLESRPDATSTASVPYLPEAQVVIARQPDYTPASLRKTLEGMCSDLWEFNEVTPKGARIAVLVDPTGVRPEEALPDAAPGETTATHPELLRALGQILLDSGAGELNFLAAVDGEQDFAALGYAGVAAALGARLIDLNRPDPYPDFADLSAGAESLVYPSFRANRILAEMDSFICLPKMKTHALAGLSLSIRVLETLVPLGQYREKEGDRERTAFRKDAKTRYPRILVDLLRARPPILALVDGVRCVDGGESNRVAGVKPAAPGLLVIGKNALAVDTVAAALMGFDASARYPTVPFTQIDNYLNIAHNLELGTNMLEKIEILGPTPEEARFAFSPPGGYKD